MGEVVVSPRDCALAVCVPLTRPAFLRAAGSSQGDFVPGLLAAIQLGAERAWEEVYEPQLAKVARRAAERVRDQGASVVENATLTDLREAAARFQVVTLLAHFRSVPVFAEDVIDPEGCLRIVAQGASLPARLIQRLVSARAPELLAAAKPPAGAAAMLATIFQLALDGSQESSTRSPGKRRSNRPASAQKVSRVMLERCFGPHLRQAPCIEMVDGLKTFEQFSTALPPAYSGVLDLSICHSMELGEELKRLRPKCLVVENALATTPGFRLARYALILQRLAIHPMRYTDAVVEVHDFLMGSGVGRRGFS